MSRTLMVQITHMYIVFQSFVEQIKFLFHFHVILLSMYSEAQAVTSSQLISRTGKFEIQKYKSHIRSEFILLISHASVLLILFCTNNGFQS